MTVVPAETATAEPEVEPMVATVGVPLLQRPPGTGLVKIAVVPSQIADDPDIVPGAGKIVTVVVAVPDRPAL